MKNWLKWKLVWCVIYVAVTYVNVKNWLKTKGLYTIVYCFRMCVVVDFTLGCMALPSKYNERYTTNFYYLCTYLVMMVVIYIMLGKLLKVIVEDRDGKTT